jgi:coenzyme F420-0:L-glutamate ligase / coenzyme F420-1:gamma-L-glutamate ligase
VRRVEVLAVEGLPEVHPGDDVAQLIASRAELEDGDVVVVAQKIVSKAEGRVRRLRDVVATDEAKKIAARLIAAPDPRAVQVVLDESVRIVRDERVLITETKHGFVCANGGVDHSNVPGDDAVTLLPDDPDASARTLRETLVNMTGRDVGVIVSDTFGRPWRVGIVNVALGVAGVRAVVDLRGTRDDSGKDLHATVLAVADDLAAAAGLVMGKTNRTPVVIVRGYEGARGEGSARDVVRPAAEDLFR